MRRGLRLAAAWVALGVAGCDTTPAMRLYCPVANASRAAGNAASPSGFFPARLAAPTLGCDGRCVAVISDSVDGWYAKQLVAAGERPLFGRARSPGAATTLRFTWLRSFDPSVVVRVERRGDTLTLIATELSEQVGYAPGTVRRTITRRWRGGDAERIERTFAVGALFAGPVGTCDDGCDGSEWLFERVDRNGYRLVSRWSPETGPARHTGLALLRATGWRFQNLY